MCKNTSLTNYIEAANCEIVQKQLRIAFDIVLDRARALSEPKPMMAHAYEAISLLFTTAVLFHGYSLVVHKQFFCDCICRRVLSKTTRIDAPNSDTFRDDTMDKVVGDTTTDDAFGSKISDAADNSSFRQDEENQYPSSAVSQGAPSTLLLEGGNDGYDHGDSATTTHQSVHEDLPGDLSHLYSEQRVPQSTPMSEHPGVFVQSSQTMALATTTQSENVAGIAQELPSEELEYDQELMEVDKKASVQPEIPFKPHCIEGTNDQENLGEPMDIENSSQCLNEEEHVAPKPSKKRSSPDSDLGSGESSEKKQKIVPSVDALKQDTLSSLPTTEQNGQPEAWTSTNRAAEPEHTHEYDSENDNDYGKAQPLSSYKVHTQNADDTDTQYFPTQQIVDRETLSLEGSNANPVSLLSDEEDEEEDNASPGTVEPIRPRNTYARDNLLQKDIPPKRKLDYGSCDSFATGENGRSFTP